jgi:hypothetical protein
MRRRRQGRVDTRSELLSLLTEACELEHGLACTYLFAAFSLKDGAQDGLSWEDQQRARRWAAQLYFVASQEMLHLAQAWNLLAAIGGTPYYGRPNFPQGARYYPLDLPFELRPFSLETLDRFIKFEAPEEHANRLRCQIRHGTPVDNEEFDYSTVGELYSLIESGFENIPEETLFVDTRSAQIDAAFVHFPDILRVVDRDSARKAIAAIKAQGEGTRQDHIDCHFGIFRAIRDELAGTRPPAGGFARACAPNPVTRVRPDQISAPSRTGGQAVTVITHPSSLELAVLFDDLYGLMLRMLAYVFAPGDARARWLEEVCRVAIEMMVMCLKPLGEALAMLPLERRDSEARAGAPFALTRVVLLPSSPATAHRLIVERLGDLAAVADEAASRVGVRSPDVGPRLARIGPALRRYGRTLDAAPRP